MKKLTKNFIIKILFIFILTLLLGSKSLASNIANSLQPVDYTDDFKKWLELSEEEKRNTMQPRLYGITASSSQTQNPFFRALRAYTDPRYSLKDTISTNLVIRNQMQTNSCWAFATLSSLETNLAMTDYKKGASAKVYDYSERHMEYATSKYFLDNATNPRGYNRTANDGGQWYTAISYLTNGQGAIAESEMPFQNSTTLINLSEIQNKAVASQVYDTVDFANYRTETDSAKALEIQNQIKQHIQNYGAVYASMHGNSSSTTAFSCYNNATGAKYCNSSTLHPLDHAVSIVGWDDNYDINNFAESARPTNKGAWIVRNSWGERQEAPLSDLKEEIFKTYQAQCIANGWSTAAEIPNTFIESAGFTIENDIAYIPMGDNGFMYVSYEDANIARTLFGIVKASNNINYENIYQYDEFYPAYQMSYNGNKIFLGNAFNKQTSNKEYITQISLYAPETYTCKVYVNPNGTNKSKSDLQLVSLKAGESQTISSGFHTLEFATPIEIKSSSFFIAVEIQTANATSATFSLETKVDSVPTFDNVKIETGKCFFTTQNTSGELNDWDDLSKLSSENTNFLNGDSTIKAYTTSAVEDISLKNIEIVTSPSKTSYYEGENFNPAGMVVKANYNNNTSRTLDSSDYSISNGTNLTISQTSVTISFEGKTTTQSISVASKPVTEKPDDKDDNKPDEKVEAKNSDFNNAITVVKKAQTYHYTKDTKKDYVLVQIEIDKVNRATTNDTVEYYYYLSPYANEQSIDNWIKISETQTSNTSLQFEIDSRKVSNFSEIANADTLYLYIKEVAVKGGNQHIFYTQPLSVKSDIKAEIFVDGVKKQNQNSSNSSNNDNTTAPGSIPQTGIKVTLSIFIIITLLGGLVFFIRYKTLTNKMK